MRGSDWGHMRALVLSLGLIAPVALTDCAQKRAVESSTEEIVADACVHLRPAARTPTLHSCSAETSQAHQPAISADQTSAMPPNCESGPVPKTYGGTKWLAYACHGNLTLVSAPDSNARPFVFTFVHQSEGYELTGTGHGNPALATLALSDLRRMSAADVQALLFEIARSPTGARATDPRGF